MSGEQTAPVGDVAVPASPAPTIVHVRERCEGSPHPYDVVTMRPKATIPMGIAVSAALSDAAGDPPRVQAALGLEMLRYGIEGWTFVEGGRDVPVSEPIERAVLERWLPFGDGGLEVVEAASALYGGDVLAPFVRRSQTRSPVMLAGHLTSAKKGSGRRPPRPSRRSSPPSTAGSPSEVPAG